MSHSTPKKLAMVSQYKRPPITEAVIELRFDGKIDRDLIDKLQGRLSTKYPFSMGGKVWNVEIGDAPPKIRQEFQGYRMTAVDGTGIVVISPSLISTSRLAPYSGWEQMIESAKENWSSWKKIIGYRRLIRVGLRYVNRIDIPNPENAPVHINKYLNLRPEVPVFGFSPIENFVMNVSIPVGNEELKLILNAGSTPSPLVKTVSFLLDIDLSRDSNLPQIDTDIWSLVDRMRPYKNSVFEGCITDEARGLFS